MTAFSATFWIFALSLCGHMMTLVKTLTPLLRTGQRNVGTMHSLLVNSVYTVLQRLRHHSIHYEISSLLLMFTRNEIPLQNCALLCLDLDNE